MSATEKIQISPEVLIRRRGEVLRVEVGPAGEHFKEFPIADAWMMLAYARRVVEWMNNRESKA